MRGTVAHEQATAAPGGRLTGVVVIGDVVVGVCFLVNSLGAMTLGRGIVIGFAASVLLIAVHLPLCRVIRRWDYQMKQPSGQRGVLWTAFTWTLAMVAVLWMFGVGAIAQALGMPVGGGLCGVVMSLHWYQFAIAALVVGGCATWEAISHRGAAGAQARDASADDAVTDETRAWSGLAHEA